jgi:hypothetical protein
LNVIKCVGVVSAPNTSSTRSDDAGYTVFTELELTEERKTVLFIRTT